MSKPFGEQAEEIWNRLSKDDQLKVFYAISKRIHKGELQDKGTYRYVLYNVFGFGHDAYCVGLECGYLDIHNALCNDIDYKLTLEEK